MVPSGAFVLLSVPQRPNSTSLSDVSGPHVKPFNTHKHACKRTHLMHTHQHAQAKDKRIDVAIFYNTHKKKTEMRSLLNIIRSYTLIVLKEV